MAHEYGHWDWKPDPKNRKRKIRVNPDTGAKLTMGDVAKLKSQMHKERLAGHETRRIENRAKFDKNIENLKKSTSRRWKMFGSYEAGTPTQIDPSIYDMTAEQKRKYTGGDGQYFKSKGHWEVFAAEDQAAVQKALNQPLSPEIQKLNLQNENKANFLNKAQRNLKAEGVLEDTAPVQKVDPWSLENVERVYEGLNPGLQGVAQRYKNLPKIGDGNPVVTNVPLAEDKPSVIDKLTDREEFALGQVRGSVAKNKARAKQIRIDQQKELLGKNIQGGPQVGASTAAENLKTSKINIDRTERIGNMQAFMKNSSPKMKEFMRNNPDAAEDLLRDAGKGLLGDKKAAVPKKTDIKKLAKNLGIETRPWKLIVNAMMALGNPNKGDKQERVDNKMGQMAANLAREGTEGIPREPDPYSWA